MRNGTTPKLRSVIYKAKSHLAGGDAPDIAHAIVSCRESSLPTGRKLTALIAPR